MRDPFEVWRMQQKHFKEIVLEEFAWAMLSNEQRSNLRKGDKLIEPGVRMNGLLPVSETFQRVEKKYPGYASAHNAYTRNHILLRQVIDKGGVQ